MVDGREPALSVIAPCYNEELNVATLVERMRAAFASLGAPAELVLVDDGSRDATWACIERAMADDPWVRGERHPKNRGIEGGWRTGLRLSRAPLVCLIDSDLQNRPEDIARLFEAYQREQPDIVQAVRHPKGLKQRMFFSRALNHILNLSFGMRLRDNKSGFILCRREVLEDVLDHRYQYRYFQSFLGVSAGVRGYRFAEVDTDFERRLAGESFLSNYPIAVSIRIMGELLKFRAETWSIASKRAK
jgi:phenylacetate-CoA ligase